MIIRCLENNFITPPVRYTLEFIFDSLGYFYEWIREEDNSASAIHLIYGDPISFPIHPAGIIHLHQVYDLANINETDLSWSELTIKDETIPVLGLHDADGNSRNEISFDIVASIYYHLTRIEELPLTHPDQIDGFVQQTMLYRYGRFLLPIVDCLVDWFGEIIERTFIESGLAPIRKAAFPHGEKFGLALTHDVDITRFNNPLKRLLYYLLHKLHWIDHSKYKSIQDSEKNTWAFHDLLDFYQQKNWQATFNFIPKLLEGRSFRYHIRSRRFRELFMHLTSNGHEIGLHSSRFAFNHPNRYKKEKRKLEHVIGEKIFGIRQHYLRCLFPQIWRVTHSLGMGYDSSLAYRRSTGFRAGTTRPFLCFDHPIQSVLDCYEFPTPFFEEALPQEGTHPPEAIKTIQKLIETVGNHHGVLTVLWHPSNMYQPDHFREIWTDIIKRIENENAFIAPLRGQLKWQKQRRQIQMEKITQLQDVGNIILSIPEDLDCLSLKIPEQIHHIHVKNAAYQIDRDNGLLIIEPGRNVQMVTIEIKSNHDNHN